MKFNTAIGICTLASLALFSLPVAASLYAPDTALLGEWQLYPEDNKWGGPIGTGASVTYSYMATGVSCSSAPETTGCSITAMGDFLPAGWQTEVERAFDAWSSVANISFTEVADLGEDFNDATQLSGDIRLGGHSFNGPGGILAHGFWPPPNGLSAAGDVHLDIEEDWKIGFGGSGFDIFQVTAHEIGHAIGLGHEETAPALMNPIYTEDFEGLLADDIAGAQYLYGPVVPLPAAGWLMLSGILALFGVKRAQQSPR